MSLDDVMLSRIIRPRMRRWWRRYGWPWLVVIGMGQLVPILPLFANPWMPLANNTLLKDLSILMFRLFFIYAPFGLPLLLCLYSGQLTMSFPERDLEEAAVPRAELLEGTLFRRALGCGLPGLIAGGLGAAAYLVLVWLALGKVYTLPLLALTCGVVESSVFAFGLALWLLALMVAFRQDGWPWCKTIAFLAGAWVLGYLKIASNWDFERVLSRYIFNITHFDSPKVLSPMAIGIAALIIVVLAIAYKKRMAAAAAALLLTLSVGLNFEGHIQLLPVSIPRMNSIVREVLVSCGVWEDHNPYWSHYALLQSYEPYYFDYMAVPSEGITVEGRRTSDLMLYGVLFAYLTVNALWLWLQYRFLYWLLSRPKREPALRKC